MRYPIVSLFLAFLTILPASAQSDGRGDPATEETQEREVTGNYLLRPSDLIRVSIYREPELDIETRIDSDGKISLKLIGEVRVGGLTRREAQQRIYELYDRDYIVNPQITVNVLEYAPRFVKVQGFVHRPGQVMIPFDRPLTLTDAIAGAGGLTNMARRGNILIKREGRNEPIRIDYDNILDGDIRDIVMQEGDIIDVKERIL